MSASALKIYYRISDNSYAKPRFGDKQRCLANFLSVFSPSPEDLIVIADRCGQPTIDMIGACCSAAGVHISNANLFRIDVGNGAGSFRYALQRALLLPDQQGIYLLEDDYLHLSGSALCLAEGLSIANYATLYDHYDKYLPREQGGNPYVQNGGEPSRVLRSASSHWKLSNSTTMTFATTVDVLRADLNIWDVHTRGSHPNDFRAFMDLQRKGRTLAVSIPGRSTHCDPKWKSPGVNWDAV